MLSSFQLGSQHLSNEDNHSAVVAYTELLLL